MAKVDETITKAICKTALLGMDSIKDAYLRKIDALENELVFYRAALAFTYAQKALLERETEPANGADTRDDD